MYRIEVGLLELPSGQSALYELPSKSRSPFWKPVCRQPFNRAVIVVAFPLTVTGRCPAGKHGRSANSQRLPSDASEVGHAVGPLNPCVIAFWQLVPARLHGPSPVAPGPSSPPSQVWNTFG